MGTLRNLRDVLKMLTRRKPSQRRCPKCASVKIHVSGSVDSWMAPKSYVCESCGWTGSVLMELDKE